MRTRIIAGAPQERRYAIVFESGDDLLEELQQFCERENLSSAFFYGIGGFRRATVGYYDIEQKRYLPIDVDEQVELLSLIGNVTRYEDRPRIHAHCIVGHRDGRTTGGHLLQAAVRPTLELFLQESAVPIARTARPDVGIPLIDL